MKFKRGWRCSHPLLRGIYGDEVNRVGGYRLECLCCGAYLDGPVAYVARNAIANEVDKL